MGRLSMVLVAWLVLHDVGWTQPRGQPISKCIVEKRVKP